MDIIRIIVGFLILTIIYLLIVNIMEKLSISEKILKSRIKIIKLITICLMLFVGSFFAIRWRAYYYIYRYLEMHNITKNEIINEDKDWTLLSEGDGSFLLSCNIKGKPQNNIYALSCNGIDSKVTTTITYSTGGFKENADLDKD